MLTELEIKELLEELRDCGNYPKKPDNVLDEDLRGQVITEIFIDKEDYPECLTICTEKDRFDYYVFGDCCSQSWLADFINLNFLVGSKIEFIKEIENLEDFGYNTNDGRGLQEKDKAYGYQFFTERGVSVLSFRNSSNGYYGGILEKHYGENQLATIPISHLPHWFCC